MTVLSDYIAQRNAAFEADDIAWAATALAAEGAPSDDKTALDAFHRARWLCSAVSEKKRRESQEWLVAHGAKHDGVFLTMADSLPA